MEKKRQTYKHSPRRKRDVYELFAWLETHPAAEQSNFRAFIDSLRKRRDRGNIKTRREKNKAWKREVFMGDADEFLTATGKDIEALADHYGVDQNLPLREKQEAVYEVMSDVLLPNEGWTREEIARKKQQFLEVLEKAQFINLTCSTVGIKESLVRSWLRTDPDFCEAVRSSQIRFGERVAQALLVKAVSGDLGAQMYALKQFGNAVQYIDRDVIGQPTGVNANAEVDITKLTTQEQEVLLGLLRKAQNIEAQKPTIFIEEDTSEEPEPEIIEPEEAPEIIDEAND